MIPSLKMTVKYADGREAPLEVKPRSQIAFERKFEVGIAAAFSSGAAVRFEHIYFLAWHASKTGLDFDDWLDTVDGIDMEAEATDPTNPAPSAGT